MSLDFSRGGKWIALGALILLIAFGGVWISQSQPPADGPHAQAPSAACFSCHGPHPPRSADEVDWAAFTVPRHLPDQGPALTCAQCHTYPAELEELSPNGCVGCHGRGGYPLQAALESLREEVGHPDVLGFIDSAPDDCLMCHRGGDMALGPRLHRRHFLGSEKFLLHFQTGCVRCHRFDESGEPSVPSQPLR